MRNEKTKKSDDGDEREEVERENASSAGSLFSDALSFPPRDKNRARRLLVLLALLLARPTAYSVEDIECSSPGKAVRYDEACEGQHKGHKEKNRKNEAIVFFFSSFERVELPPPTQTTASNMASRRRCLSIAFLFRFASHRGHLVEARPKGWSEEHENARQGAHDRAQRLPEKKA